jgi:plastocyanin
MKKYIFFILLLLNSIPFGQTTHYVNAGMMYYSPSAISINQGDTVIWINDGGTHDVNGDINSLTGQSFNNPESFDSEIMSTVGGEIYTHVFNIPGLYNYDCSVYGHASAGMIGSVNVNSLDLCDDDDESIFSFFGDMFINDCPGLISFLINSYNYTEDQSCQWDGNPMFNLNGMIIADYCECSCSSDEQSYTVVDVIVNSENHTILEAAVIAAELDDDLSGDGPFTVFAPTDDAFNALPAGTVDELLINPTGDLANILLHHVASGSVLSTDLSDGMSVTTLFGTELTVSISDDGVMIDNAMVTAADITTDNGVVHVC